jgi:hypothetical protein
MIYGKEVRVFLRGQAKEAYLELKERHDKEARSIFRSFERAKEILKSNPQYGSPIAKNRIPESLRRTGVKNLYRAELSNCWRMLYTLEGTRVEIRICP